MRLTLSRLWLVLLLVVAGAAFALELHFIDVGQGDAVLIVAPDGRAVIYDGGPDVGTMLAYVRRLGVEVIPMVVASHAHADHIGGLPAVIDAFAPSFVLDNGVPHTTLAYERYLESVARSGAQLLAPERRVINLGEVRLHVLPSPVEASWGHNDNSVGLVVEYGDFRATLTGDAEERLFGWWLAAVPDLFGPVQVHKASHHGSEYGATSEALARLRPEVVVVSVGAGNPYGHPHPVALARYTDVGATIFRTDLGGTVRIVVQPDGTYQVMRQGVALPAAEPPPVLCVDLNHADIEALQTIVHIGPVRAEAIALYRASRPFNSVEELARIDGIGPARLRDILGEGRACVH